MQSEFHGMNRMLLMTMHFAHVISSLSLLFSCVQMRKAAHFVERFRNFNWKKKTHQWIKSHCEQKFSRKVNKKKHAYITKYMHKHKHISAVQSFLRNSHFLIHCQPAWIQCVFFFCLCSWVCCLFSSWYASNKKKKRTKMIIIIIKS